MEITELQEQILKLQSENKNLVSQLEASNQRVETLTKDNDELRKFNMQLFERVSSPEKEETTEEKVYTCEELGKLLGGM